MARKKTESASIEEVNTDVEPVKRGGLIMKFIIILIIAGLACATIYYYKQYKKIKDNPQAVSQEETQAVISEVGKLMELPEGTPSLATVQDKERLKDQSFFKNAQNGDKVLIYTDAKQAILFRPTTKKIIEVAPLILNNPEGNGGTSASETPADGTNQGNNNSGGQQDSSSGQ